MLNPYAAQFDAVEKLVLMKQNSQPAGINSRNIIVVQTLFVLQMIRWFILQPSSFVTSLVSAESGDI